MPVGKKAKMAKNPDFIGFLRPRTGLSPARIRAREVEKRMNKLLKQDRETFKRALIELGLNEEDPEYENALKVYDATS
jgi:hypothetical protein